MASKTFLRNSKIAILKLNNSDYIENCEIPTAPFTHQPSGLTVNPLVELFTMTKDEAVTLDPTQTIVDSSSPVITYQKIVGPRPKNIVKR